MEVASRVFVLGNSNAVRIPRLIMDALSLRANDPVTLEVRDNEMVIKKQERKTAYPSINELFEGYTGSYQPTEMESDGVVGREMI
jgi:antitoxin component of MazEF toxin-antitoxin module